METYLNIMLIRFGIIAAIVVVLVIVVFAAALILRRRGKLGAASKAVAPALKKFADSTTVQGQNTGARRRGGWLAAVARFVADYLEKHSDSRSPR